MLTAACSARRERRSPSRVCLHRSPPRVCARRGHRPRIFTRSARSRSAMMRKAWRSLTPTSFAIVDMPGHGQAVMARVVGEHLQGFAVSEGQSLRSVGALAQPPRKEGLIRLPLALVVRFPRSWDLDRAIVELLDPDLDGNAQSD